MNSARKCEIVQEISYMPGGPNGWEKLLRQALKHPNIKGWAYILHDKDIDDQGNPIAPHVHIVIILHDSVKYSTIGGYIGVPAQYVQSIKQRIRKGKHYQSDVGGALSYLTHRNAKDKHQYDDSEVVAKPGFNWRGLRAESERAQAEQRSLNQIYKDIETGKIREFDLFKHISMGAYIDNKTDIDRAFEYRKGVLKLNSDRKIDVIYICGEPGAGKTTLAKIIMGLVRPTSGRVLYNGEDVTELSITERARRGISYGFQQPPRFKGITVHDLLLLAAGQEKLSKDKCCAYLTKVGLCANDYLDREVDVSLSGGEVKRIEIATILARHSDLMIFDEPEAGIDLWSFARLTETFEQIHREGDATMIIISHQERIIRLADEIVVIANGQIAHRGSTDQIFPLILADTLGSCPVLERKEAAQ